MATNAKVGPAWSQGSEVHQGLPHGWQGPRNMGSNYRLAGEISRKLSQTQPSWDSHWDIRCLCAKGWLNLLCPTPAPQPDFESLNEGTHFLLSSLTTRCSTNLLGSDIWLIQTDTWASCPWRLSNCAEEEGKAQTPCGFTALESFGPWLLPSCVSWASSLPFLSRSFLPLHHHPRTMLVHTC